MTAPARSGPRPLGLHLTAAGMISASSLGGWMAWNSGLRPWRGPAAADAEALRKDLEAVSPDAFAAALLDELARRHDAFLTGIETYRRHPARRALGDPPALWEKGSARLLDYGAVGRGRAASAGGGRPVLVVPSLVNRSYILDLTAERSLLRFLAGRDVRPLLLDWGTPGSDDLGLGLDDIVGDRLAAALDVATRVSGGRKVPVVGYCMGGTLAVGLAALRPDAVAALALLATPWDFHADTGGPPPMVTLGRPALDAVVETFGCLPVDVLQTLFFSLDPVQSWTKFRRFARLDPDGPAAAAFVALEDWVNDGVPLAGPAARDCLFGWYGDNAPAAGAWTVAGTAVEPQRLDLPALVVIPARDRIVPPAAAAALADALPAATALSPRAGHIGMIVGSGAKAATWSPLAAWLGDLE